MGDVAPADGSPASERHGERLPGTEEAPAGVIRYRITEASSLP
jgi:hypothetical protein